MPACYPLLAVSTLSRNGLGVTRVYAFCALHMDYIREKQRLLISFGAEIQCSGKIHVAYSTNN